jgi:hypothetical protein
VPSPARTAPPCRSARASRTSPGPGSPSPSTSPPTTRVAPLDEYAEKVVRARRRGLVYPYELVSMVAGSGGSVQELDLDESGRLVPGRAALRREHRGHHLRPRHHPDPPAPRGREPGAALRRPAAGPRRGGRAGVRPGHRGPGPRGGVGPAGRVVRPVSRGPDRHGLGHREHGLDREGAARIIEFTQAGGEINIVVAGINVGGQPYWNAEATMLMHTKGILVMTPDSAMVLTGKQSLDFSGWRERRGQLRHRWLRPRDGPQRPGAVLGQGPPRRLRASCCAHYENTYVVPGERGPRRRPTSRPARPRRLRRTRTRCSPAATSRASATSSRRRPTPTARSPSTSAR